MERLRYKKKKKSLFKKIILTSSIIVMASVSYFGYVAYSTYTAATETYSTLDRGNKSKLRSEEIKIQEDPFSILLLGIEDYSSGGTNGRSDSIMVATLNPQEQSIKLLSIPRDTLVPIPNQQTEDKINHSYVFGGKDSTIETVEQFLEIPIDYYATINFKGFKRIIDDIDGIRVDVPFDFWEVSDEDGHKIYFNKGLMNLNGEEALAYARMRKQDPLGDFGRNERQKEIIQSSVKKILSPNNLFKIDKMANHLGDNVETNLSISELLGIQKGYSDFNSSEIEKFTITGEDTYIDNIYYFQPDEIELENIKKQLQDHLNHTIND